MKNLSFSKRFIALFLVSVIFAGIAQAQSNRNFPNGSPRGNTEMGRNVAPVQIPNVSVNITEPQTGCFLVTPDGGEIELRAQGFVKQA